MRRIFEWVGGFTLIAFSFYFTDKVSLLVAKKSELYTEIESVSSLYETEPVDAIIDAENNTIIPGKFGKIVNSEESYLEMHDFGSFNENYLIFDYVKPNTSILDHKDKFITSGNKEKRRISLIINNNELVEKYFNNLLIDYNRIVQTYENTTNKVELINGAQNKVDFNTFNTSSNNSKICVKHFSDLDRCIKHKYFLIDTKLILNDTNLIEIKNNIESGAIILISSDAKVEDVKILMNEIEFKDLQIVHISKLINEKESD